MNANPSTELERQRHAAAAPEAVQSEPKRLPLVVVTGGSGLIGAPLVRRLAERYRVAVLDVAELPKELSAVSHVDWLACDLTDEGDVSAAFDAIHTRYGDRIAAVVHLAAHYDFSGEPSPLYDALTVQGTRRLLRALAGFDRVERFIFASSLLVMRPVELGQTIDEASPTEADWDYPKSKLAAEEAIRIERGGLPVAIARLAGVYDADGHSPPLVHQIARIYERSLESHLFPGDVDHGQSFIHLRDAVDSLERLVEKRREYGDYEVFLLGEREVLSYGELQNMIGEIIYGKAWSTVRIPKFVAKAGAWAKDKLASEGDRPFIKPWMIDIADAHYPVDIKKTKHWLGWEPKHLLRETLPVIVRSLLADPDRWYRVNGLPVPAGVAD